MRLSRALARRVDRLAVRAHAFHRYAHHPLCERYRGEVIALRGRTRVCRGCASALIGACGGAALALAVSSAAWLPLMAAAAGSLAWALATVAPQRLARTAALARRASRPSKLWTRAFPAFAATWALVALARAASPLALLPVAAAISGMLAYRRRGPDRTPCRDCPEQRRQPCSGYRPILRAERAFVRLSQRLIDAEGSRS